MYGHSVDDLGFTLVFRDLVKSKKVCLTLNLTFTFNPVL